MRSAPFLLNKLASCFLLSSTLLLSSAYAIEIEQRPLSTNPQPAAVAKPEPKSLAAPEPLPTPAPAVAQVAAPAPVKAAPSAVNPAWDMFQQIEELRGTVAKLQGTVEEQQQLIERLQSDLRTRYTDLDQRLEQLSKPAAEPASPAVVPSEPTPTAQVQPAEPNPAPVVIASKPKAELTTEEIERQKTAYLAAYQSFRRDGAAPAIVAMTRFLETFPDSVFAPNAYYWLGEFQLAAEPANYAKAEANFQRVLKDYSASPKVASAFYKLGTIADLQGDKTAAKSWMTKLLKQFPGSPEARLAQSFIDQNPAK